MRQILRRGAFLVVAAMASQSVLGQQVFTSVSVSGGDAPITNGPPNGTQRENDQAGTVVPFGEDVFAYNDRTHQWNGARFNSAGTLSTAVAAGDLTPGLPTYLTGREYISTNLTNRDNASLVLSITVNQPVTAYLLVDNRIGKGTANGPNTTPPTLGSGGAGVMPWVADNGWTIVNTGFAPNGQPDVVGSDEGSAITDWTVRSTTPANLETGTGNGLNQFFTVYRHDFPAGTFQTFQQNDGTSRSMYGVVLAPIPEPTGAGLLAGVALIGLARRRRGTRA